MAKKAKPKTSYSLSDADFREVYTSALQGLVSNPAIIGHVTAIHSSEKVQQAVSIAWQIAVSAMEYDPESEAVEQDELNQA